MELTPDAQAVISAARQAGGFPLIVGGAVRDTILGVPFKDIDIEVHGLTDLDGVAARLAGVSDEIGKSFGVLKFRDIDISLPRRDSKVGPGHQGFTVEFDKDISIVDALARRDFTVNAMAWDPRPNGGLIDPFGGIRDIDLGVLKHTSAAFSDDPLRVLRGIQFAGRFGWTFDPLTAHQCRGLIHDFVELSIERVWGEWEKIFDKGRSFSHVKTALVDSGWLKHFPEFAIANVGHADRRLIGKGAAVIIAGLFKNNHEAAVTFMQRIDAPVRLRQHVKRLLAGEGQIRDGVRVLARAIAPATVQEFALVFDAPFLDAEARRQGVLTAPHSALVTGETLISLGHKPGPKFKGVLQQAAFMQDTGFSAERIISLLDKLFAQE